MGLRKSVIQKVVARLPAGLNYCLQKTPDSLLKHNLTFWLNRCFKAAIKQGELDFLNGRKAVINITDLNVQFAVGLEKKHLRVTLPDDCGDVYFRAGMQSLLALMTSKSDPDTLFFQRRLLVSGDTELGLALKNFFDRLDASQVIPKPLYALLKTLSDIGAGPDPEFA